MHEKNGISYLVVILASLRSLFALADFSMPKSSCITLDLFGCPTLLLLLLLLPATFDEGTATVDTAVVSLLVEELGSCFLPGLSKPGKVDDSGFASRKGNMYHLTPF